MGSGESKAHSKRKPTVSSGFLGRERHVQSKVSRAIYRTITGRGIMIDIVSTSVNQNSST